MKISKQILLLVVAFCGWFVSANAQSEWPKEIPYNNGGKITIYQPQPEKLEGVKLSGRAAVSIRKHATDEPIFGAVWMEATLNTSNSNGTATLETLKVTQTKFPAIEDAQQLSDFAAAIEQEVPNWNLSMSLERLKSSIRQEQQLDAANLKNDPPKIIFKTSPSTLVTIEGEPKIQRDNNFNMERVINTPSLILRNPADKKFYLYGGGNWYVSATAKTGYTVTPVLPAKIKLVDVKLKEQEAAAAKDKDPVEKNTTPTEIVVSTVPAELIQTEGEPSFKPIQGTSLLYADNSLDEIFKDINSQQNYILIAGRWYTSVSMNGPWEYVAADQLPADFAKIPEGSEKDGVLASVAGTDAAEEAKADAVIPQTAKIDRKTATCSVSYDGTPKFSPIDNTSLYVADNSNITVLKARDTYYAVENGVWFRSKQATGPWEVSTERPSDIEKIPPSNRAYNTKYVYVYESTPDYVYTGYTPGYMGGYIYGPTVVWGTGWYYQPWYGAVYYPRPVTYGFGMHYNPYSGWNLGFGMSFNVGWFHFGTSNWGYGRGWFGPSMYRPPYASWGYHGGYYGRSRYVNGRNTVVINSPNVYINRPQGNNFSNRNQFNNNRNNLYNNRRDVINTNNITRRPGTLATDRRVNGNNNSRLPALNTNRPFARPSRDANNIFTDREGNIFKKESDGKWNQRERNNWKPADNTRIPREVNRDDRARDRANTREQNNRVPVPSRPSTPVVRPDRPSRQQPQPQARPSTPQTRPQGGGQLPPRKSRGNNDN